MYSLGVDFEMVGGQISLATLPARVGSLTRVLQKVKLVTVVEVERGVTLLAFVRFVVAVHPAFVVIQRLFTGEGLGAKIAIEA